MNKRGLSRLEISIKVVGVWDTVGKRKSSLTINVPPNLTTLGSLGIPRIAWLERLRLQSPLMKEYMFYDTSLSNCIENAFQALALDEHRSAFSPSVWEKPRGNTTVSYRASSKVKYNAVL